MRAEGFFVALTGRKAFSQPIIQTNWPPLSSQILEASEIS
jgi:hypothetical protein